ncbi:TPA: DNA polymerase II [Candidatus Woesearchaeota archaeon]|nr:DNA polymerase II [Candidatus Woesearchaeota archaeon]HIH31323.1 DNA polymerase II [Candidatus Woesearchaeota archaeon]HIH55386.1 DNA polymerase II [Candidatus Woesearchaeota archaeon]HIJ01578.1 DNA polymerase II [Candidatus Woesearchaeota archaeon]HIJ14577.1 DNA polymerase II [Candidatus Woesearchaeota archaeon]
MHDSINGFIVYPTYRIVDDESEEGKAKRRKKALVYLFGRLENGESFLTINHVRPYFYVKTEDLKNTKLQKALKDFDAVTEDSDFRNFEDENVTKIILWIPADVAKFRKYLEEINIECYEADIRFYQRFLIDKDIKGSLTIKGDFKKGNYVDRIYEEPELKSSKLIPDLKVLSIDIETDSKAKGIYCISLYTEGLNNKSSYKQVLLHASDKDIGKPLHNAISINTEKEMLEKFSELVKEIDPDIITGWNVIDFDLKLIKEKFDKYNIPFTLGRIDWPCKIEINDSFMRDSSADFPGRMVLDGIQMLRTSFVKLDNYKLETAAQAYLGEKKLIGQKNKAEEIDNLYKNDQQKLVDYNLKDSELVYKILFKTSAIQLTIQRSMITGMTLERVRASVASLDSLFLRYAKHHKLVLNSTKFSEKDVPFKGGFVMKSKPGIYDYVLVLDFKSLYPSIIRTLNIDPYSYVKNPPKILNKDKFIQAANGAVFKNQDGILPSIIQDVWKQRDDAKKKKAQAHVIYALKIIMNSFYGVLGNPSCRFYNPAMSNAITYTAEETIKLAAKKVEELGYEVIYSDTDSIFLVSKAKNISDAENIGKKIEKHVNDFYEDYIKERYHRKSFFEIQFEKLFKVFLMPTIRGSEEGAKKRYAGLLIVDGKEEMSFTGMEFVRGDWTELSKKFQIELFEKVFNKEEVSGYIKKFVDDLKKGKYDDKLIYKKSINKPLSEYTKTTPPHVKAARQLKKLTSNQIFYIITKNGPEPVEKLKHKPDYDHYIDKQLKPIADTILSVYGKNFDDIFRNSTQSSLFGY